MSCKTIYSFRTLVRRSNSADRKIAAHALRELNRRFPSYDPDEILG